MLFHFQVEGGVHVHRHCFDLLAALAQQCEERAYGLTAVALAHPQYARALGIHDDRGVAMTFVQGELVHDQTAHIAWIEVAHAGLQAALVDGLDRVPVQPGESADMADRQHLQQRFDPCAQPLCQA
ncbi:hypothetical protein D3C80_1626920 [compost metagenome]